jgi:hypothetical protein
VDNKPQGDVVRQSLDTSIMNTEPVVAKAAVVGVVGSVLLALAAFGIVTEEQRLVIIEQIGNITYGLFTLLPIAFTIISAVWGRLSAFSPKRAAGIAVVNSVQPPSVTPTLAASDTAIEAAVMRIV